MIFYLLITFVTIIKSYEQPCFTCKHYIPNIYKPHLSLCNMFKDRIGKNDVLIKNFAIHCRSSEDLCGKSGFLHENNDILNNIEELNENCSSEFTDEKDLEELEKLEKELVDVFQRMRKHNTKKIYYTTKKHIKHYDTLEDLKWDNLFN